MKHLLLIIPLSIAALLSGCSLFPKADPVPARQYYTLRPDLPAPEGKRIVKTSVRVNRFRLGPDVRPRAIAARLGDGRIRVSRSGEFYSDLNVVFQEAARDAVRFSGCLRPADSAHEDPRFVLDGEVTELDGDFSDPETPRAVLHFSLVLGILHPDGSYEKIATSRYEEVADIENESDAAIVKGVKELLGKALAQWAENIAKYWPEIAKKFAVKE